jgi:hypothetical protein
LFVQQKNILLIPPPDWVQRAIGRRMRTGKLTVVSAVCPDYERVAGKFTYKAMGSSVPFTAQQHLQVVKEISALLNGQGVELNYIMTLADTEFDLPLVVEALCQGDASEFLRRCQESCHALQCQAEKDGLVMNGCRRFTDVFPEWFEYYTLAYEHVKAQTAASASAAQDLAIKACSRATLYKAMAGQPVSQQYCHEMVLRQWAQYATWGELATRTFGQDIVMMNHSTPNLSLVNAPFFRAGRERIPILEINITTMP